MEHRESKIIWGLVNSLTTPQLISLKKSIGLRLRDVSADAKLAFFSVLNDKEKYSPITEDKLFFVLCTDALLNRYNISENWDPATGKAMTFQEYLGRIYKDKNATDSTKRDITALCAEKSSECGRLEKHMMNYIFRMKKDGCHINSKEFEKDLLGWDRDTHYVQIKWGSTIVKPAYMNYQLP